MLEVTHCRVQGRSIDGYDLQLALARLSDKSGPSEHLDVLGHRRERHGIIPCDLADIQALFGDALENIPSRRIAEGAEDEVQTLYTFNHFVECNPPGRLLSRTHS